MLFSRIATVIAFYLSRFGFDAALNQMKHDAKFWLNTQIQFSRFVTHADLITCPINESYGFSNRQCARKCSSGQNLWWKLASDNISSHQIAREECHFSVLIRLKKYNSFHASLLTSFFSVLFHIDFSVHRSRKKWRKKSFWRNFKQTMLSWKWRILMCFCVDVFLFSKIKNDVNRDVYILL